MSFRTRFILVLIVLIVAFVWGYFTQQLPFGWSRSLPSPVSLGTGAPPVAGRSDAGQPATLGAISYVVTAAERNQDLLPSGQGEEAVKSTFLVLHLQIRNSGREPITPAIESFQLQDAQGRRYGADPEASRAAAGVLKRRVPGTAVQPGSTLSTALAFEVPPDASGLALRLTLGSALMELPER